MEGFLLKREMAVFVRRSCPWIQFALVIVLDTRFCETMSVLGLSCFLEAASLLRVSIEYREINQCEQLTLAFSQ